MTPLPTVSRPPAQLINVNWVVASLAAIFLLGAGLLLLRGGDEPTAVLGSQGAGDQTTVPSSPSTQVQAPPVTSAGGPAQGEPIGPIRPGEYPDFVGADLASALAVLTDNQMAYVIVEVTNAQTPEGLVISQSPDEGSSAGPNDSITLVVSAGAAAE
jgi:hypothetical protein